MPFNIVHIVSSLEKVNFGIWNAAIAGSAFLKAAHDIQSHLWVCDRPKKGDLPRDVSIRWFGDDTADTIRKKVSSDKILICNSVVVTHGCWLRPTRVGYALRKLGYPWIYVPHGMLEPWSMQQGWLKKRIYYSLAEKKMAKFADAIRAVSGTEGENLKRRFARRIDLIENGVDTPEFQEKPRGPEDFLFMARLHYKKGIVPLVQAWRRSMKDTNQRLIIAGPDEGELERIIPYLNDNIKYVGAVYGEEKRALLRNSHYFMLPSFSEGFPTSVVEAMSYGLIPVISQGCNFPEVFSGSLGYRMEPDAQSIDLCLDTLKRIKFDRNLSRMNHEFIRENYSTDCIGRKLHALYTHVMDLNKSVADGKVLFQ